MDAGQVIHFAQVDFRNDNRLFGIKPEDRFSHIYITGKTGTGRTEAELAYLSRYTHRVDIANTVSSVSLQI